MGLIKKLFGGKKRQESGLESVMTPSLAEKIIQDYDAILQSSAPLPGCVADVSKLPHPRERIKEALVVDLESVTDPQMKESLKIGYLQLADWQEGVGESDVGIHLTETDLSDDPMKQAERIMNQHAEAKKWVEIVKAEQKALEAELRDKGLW
jgi:hypothetical protein